MLVDSHCHLDFPDFADELDAVVGARQGGRHRPHRDDLDPGAPARRSARHRRALSRRLLLGRHASAQRPRGARHRHGRSGRAHARIPRWWRSARPGSTITTTTRRATRRSRASAPISRRRARPACRWSSMRARPTPTWRAILRGGNREGRLPGRAALLHRRPRPGLRRHRARPLRVVHRHPDLQEIRRAARHRRATCRPTASWSRPTRPISRPANSAASATSRPMWSRPPRCWRRSRGVTPSEIARQTTENFFRLFCKVPRPARRSSSA